jgi:hypothetical protein
MKTGTGESQPAPNERQPQTCGCVRASAILFAIAASLPRILAGLASLVFAALRAVTVALLLVRLPTLMLGTALLPALLLITLVALSLIALILGHGDSFGPASRPDKGECRSQSGLALMSYTCESQQITEQYRMPRGTVDSSRRMTRASW